MTPGRCPQCTSLRLNELARSTKLTTLDIHFPAQFRGSLIFPCPQNWPHIQTWPDVPRDQKVNKGSPEDDPSSRKKNKWLSERDFLINIGSLKSRVYTAVYGYAAMPVAVC